MAHYDGLNEFKKLLRDRFAEKKLTKTFVAAQLGISINHLTRILEQDTAPNIETGIRLARVLGISAQEVYDVLSVETEHDLEQDLRMLLRVQSKEDSSWNTFWDKFKTSDISAKRALRDLLHHTVPAPTDLPSDLELRLYNAAPRLTGYWQDIFHAAGLMDVDNHEFERHVWSQTIATIFDGQCSDWRIIKNRRGKPLIAPASFEIYVHALEKALEALQPEEDVNAMFLGVSVLMPRSWYNWRRRNNLTQRSEFYERPDISAYRRTVEKVVNKLHPGVEHHRLILRTTDTTLLGLGIDDAEPKDQENLYIIEQVDEAQSLGLRQGYDEDHFVNRRDKLAVRYPPLEKSIRSVPGPKENVYIIVHQEELIEAKLLNDKNDLRAEVPMEEGFHAVRLVHRFKNELHSKPEFACHYTAEYNELAEYINTVGPEFDIGLFGTYPQGQSPKAPKWKFVIGGSWSHVGNTLLLKFFTEPDTLQWIGDFWYDKYVRGITWE